MKKPETVDAVKSINPSAIMAGMVEATVLPRQEDYLIVNKHELDDLVEEVGDVPWLFSIGIFLLSGALWSLVSLVGAQGPVISALSVFYGMATVLGLVLVAVGRRDQGRAQRRLRRIISTSASRD